MVYLHHLASSPCSSLHLFHGSRYLSSNQIRQFLNIGRPHPLHHGHTPKQDFLLPFSEFRHHANSCSFYNQLSKRLSDASVILDLFACSLDQVGAAELRQPVEQSGGFMILSESFESDQFKKCLGHMFKSPMESKVRRATRA
ncbi:uncharacterized protein HKW66_Vig0144050 [Vigna angularis]|uniref:Protein transport protein SEC23 n=1 Tax=Phaseolus angularis TaxID=3914 RepID=A0A8T0KDP2_PHAAN|nr:uncharacterized protein HKW66_Vig0144050 [Vigna angularis]